MTAESLQKMSRKRSAGKQIDETDEFGSGASPSKKSRGNVILKNGKIRLDSVGEEAHIRVIGRTVCFEGKEKMFFPGSRGISSDCYMWKRNGKSRYK